LKTSRATAVALVTFATFTDIVAYSVCVPVLPDLARRLGSSPTAIGLLFASFGVTLLAVAIPTGAASDRIGRKVPLVAGMLGLAAATTLFAFARSLPWLFAARMAQGAADGVTWVVGFALVADLYGPEDRGRVMGYVMSGTSVAVVLGPTMGGWLYEAGGLALPFLAVAAMALACAGGFLWIRPEVGERAPAAASAWMVLRVPAVAVCGVFVVLVGGTMAMLEPVLPLFFNRQLGLTPAQVGVTFGAAAVASAIAPFVYGPMTDRWGGRRLTPIGLLVSAAWLPALAAAGSFRAAILLSMCQWAALALVITPSLAYMADVTAFAGKDAYGIGFGLYNTAWAIGTLGGPALGGWLFDRVGLRALSIGWAIGVAAITIALTASPSFRSDSTPRR
jgi:predicted MFS family arabinose efflux permease